MSEEESKAPNSLEDEEQKESDSSSRDENEAASEEQTISEGITLEGYVEEDGYAPLMKLIEEKENQLSAEKDRYLRLLADFDNYKKRVQKEKSDQSEYAGEQILREILPIIDNLERALTSAQEQCEDVAGIISGLGLILSQFQAFLKKNGVEPMESVGEVFDPKVHEAVAQMPVEEEESGRVISEEVKGYLLRGKLLRPAQVVVGKVAEEDLEAEGDNGRGDE